MRVEVWVHAVGDGPVSPAAVERVRVLLGDDCLGATALPGRWSLGVIVDAASLREAMSVASAQAQACAATAGLPAWPITDISAEGPERRDGIFKTRRTAGATLASASPGDDDGSAGVREPLVPKTPPPTLTAEREVPRDE